MINKYYANIEFLKENKKTGFLETDTQNTKEFEQKEELYKDIITTLCQLKYEVGATVRIYQTNNKNNDSFLIEKL